MNFHVKNGGMITATNVTDLDMPVVRHRTNQALMRIYKELCSRDNDKWVSTFIHDLPFGLEGDQLTSKNKIIIDQHLNDIIACFNRNTSYSVNILRPLAMLLKQYDAKTNSNTNSDCYPYYNVADNGQEIRSWVENAYDNEPSAGTNICQIIAIRKEKAQNMLQDLIMESPNLEDKEKLALIKNSGVGYDASLGNITAAMCLWLCQEKHYHAGDINEIYVGAVLARNEGMETVAISDVMRDPVYAAFIEENGLEPSIAWKAPNGALIMQLGGPFNTDGVIMRRTEDDEIIPEYLEMKDVSTNAHVEHDWLMYDEDSKFSKEIVQEYAPVFLPALKTMNRLHLEEGTFSTGLINTRMSLYDRDELFAILDRLYNKGVIGEAHTLTKGNAIPIPKKNNKIKGGLQLPNTADKMMFTTGEGEIFPCEVGNFPQNFLRYFSVVLNAYEPAGKNWNPCFTPELAYRLFNKYFDREEKSVWKLNALGNQTFKDGIVYYPIDATEKEAAFMGEVDDDGYLYLVCNKKSGYSGNALFQRLCYFEMDVQNRPSVDAMDED